MEELCTTQLDFINNLISLGFISSIKDALTTNINTNITTNNNNSSNTTNSATTSSNENQCHPNRNAFKTRLFHSILCCGLYPNIAKVFRPPTRYIEIAGGVVERDLEAKELKFYINTK